MESSAVTAQDRDAPKTEERVEALLAAMTIEEKLGQLNMPIQWPPVGGTTLPPATPDELERYVAGTWIEALGSGGGLYLLPPPMTDPADQAALSNRLQEVARSHSRLGIPIVLIAEGCHGVISAGHTVFPQGPALGATWNPALLEDVYTAVAREARAVGIHMLSTLAIEPIRDPRLGRNCEAHTEDPHLASCYAFAIVHGVQGDDVSDPDRAIALLTCFPGQSEAASGLERGAMEITERTLREIYLPPWQAGITRGGALGVMATYPSIDGRVAHGSSWLYTELLREELGFEGITVSEGSGFETLIYEGIVGDQGDAGVLGIWAGIDVSITWEEAFLAPLRANVESGRVPMELLDRAVRRILQVKLRLGLFDDPLVDVDRAASVVHSTDHIALARRAAREGIVLLRNEGDLLPLDRSVARIAVIGPNADVGVNQLGDYTMAMINQAEHLPSLVTVLDGVRAAAGQATEVLYASGCSVLGDDMSGFAEAVEAAAGADVAIVVLGEQQGLVSDPDNRTTVGEQADVASLDLTGVQQQLVEAIHATGTPTVVVLINGRALSIRWIADNIPAVVEAWLPGERGGEAIADVLFGDHNPSGRLPVTIPRHSGQLPVYYNQRRARQQIVDSGFRFAKDYIDLPRTPLYEFGYGLSYTTFEYENLSVEPSGVGPDTTVRVTVDVRNSGNRLGTETVQLYIRDVLASLAPRVKQLRDFAKVTLAPGETATIEFGLGPEALMMLDADMCWVVEPGDFEVQIGASSADIRVTDTFTVSTTQRAQG